MLEEVKCPICGSDEIIYHEMVEEYMGLSTVYQTWEGHCEKCKAILRWVEEYTLQNISDPVVVK